MPSGTAVSPGGFPIGLAFFGFFPNGKVQRTVFFVIDVNAGTDFEIVDVLAGEFAVSGKFVNGKVDIAVDVVSHAVVDEFLDHGDDVGDGLGDPGMDIGAANAQGIGVFEIFVDVFVSHGFGADAFFMASVYDFVVHIGKVLDKGDVVTDVFQKSSENVKNDERAGVADMEIVINRRSAGVHADFSIFDGDEFFFTVIHCVV